MEGRVAVTGGEVWYRRIEGGPGAPVLMLHGGPGASALQFECDLGRVLADRPVVVYDQLGSKRSDHPDDASLWTVERFVEELGQVRAALALDEVHLLGHSWGAMLAASSLETDPGGVRSVVFSSPCLDAHAWADDQRHWLEGMPEATRETIEAAEASGRVDTPAYEQATTEFYRRHLCRLDPWPPAVAQMVEELEPAVYGLMWGPSEFTLTGTLRDFDARPGLGALEMPALFVCGEYDEARPETVRTQAALAPHGRFVEVPEASHMTMFEQPAIYWDAVASFLDDATG